MSIVKSAGTFAGCAILLVAACACGNKHDDDSYDSSRTKPTSSYDAARDSNTTGSDTNANNTARNAEPGATPIDQGNSTADLSTTQKIRQAVMDEANLSTTAKNVKIITRDGKVTLRGPVNASNEKSRIEEIAVSIAGTGNVMNEIEIAVPQG